MKAEEFLNRNHHAVVVTHNDGAVTHNEEVDLDNAIYAVSKARKEERSKALSSFDSALVGLTIKEQDGAIVDLRILKARFRDFINR